MKNYIAAALVGAALTLAPFGAMAADATQQKSPLAPGSAAGVKQAQDWSWDDNRTAYLIGGAAVIAGVIIIASNNGNGSSNSTSGTH